VTVCREDTLLPPGPPSRIPVSPLCGGGWRRDRGPRTGPAPRPIPAWCLGKGIPSPLDSEHRRGGDIPTYITRAIGKCWVISVKNVGEKSVVARIKNLFWGSIQNGNLGIGNFWSKIRKTRLLITAHFFGPLIGFSFGSAQEWPVIRTLAIPCLYVSPLVTFFLVGVNLGPCRTSTGP